MKVLSSIVAFSLVFAPAVCIAHGGGGGGHHGGGGGHGGGGHHRGGGHRQGGGGHYGHHYGHGNWNGNHWHGNYYSNGYGYWGASGLFLVGLTFYTCTTLAIKNTNTWVIYSSDVDIYNTWPDQEKISIMQVQGDSEWPYRLCYNDGSCVKARPAPNY